MFPFFSLSLSRCVLRVDFILIIYSLSSVIMNRMFAWIIILLLITLRADPRDVVQSSDMALPLVNSFIGVENVRHKRGGNSPETQSFPKPKRKWNDRSVFCATSDASKRRKGGRGFTATRQKRLVGFFSSTKWWLCKEIMIKRVAIVTWSPLWSLEKRKTRDFLVIEGNIRWYFLFLVLVLFSHQKMTHFFFCPSPPLCCHCCYVIFRSMPLADRKAAMFRTVEWFIWTKKWRGERSDIKNHWTEFRWEPLAHR